jgi:hypothetical protein
LRKNSARLKNNNFLFIALAAVGLPARAVIVFYQRLAATYQFAHCPRKW